VDPDCDCQMCQLPAGYIAHLFRLEEAMAGTLASLHNLRFYARLTDALRASARSAAPPGEAGAAGGPA
jgi:queuine tRNA-ribosyltransferase